MNFERFIVRKIAFSAKKSFSRFIVSIAIAAVAISLSVMIIAVSLVNGFQNEIKRKTFGFWAHIHVKPYSMNTSLKEPAVYLYQDFYKNQDELEGVKHIQKVAYKGGILRTSEDFEGIKLKGVGTDFTWDFFEEYLKEGERMYPTDTGRLNEIIVSNSTAKRLKLNVGDGVIVSFFDGARERKRKLNVEGIYSTGLEDFDKEHAIVDIALIQHLNQWGSDTVGVFEVFVDDIDNLNEMGNYMNANVGSLNLKAITMYELQPNIFDWLKLQSTNEIIILIIMILVSVLNMITAILILIIERTNMIGTLKALGADDWMIQKIFLWNAGYVITVGLIVGNAVGIGICLLQKHLELIKLDETAYYVSVAPVDLSASWIIGLNLITLLVCLFAMLLPTLLVTMITPVKALRFS